MSPELSHLDEHGKAFMVDVTAKAATYRRAETRAVVVGVGGWQEWRGDTDVLGAARVAGLAAAKQTSELIPLCHPLPLSAISLDFVVGDDQVEVFASAETVGQTGVEMEALTACAVASLSILAALGPTRPGASIEELTLWHKSGGRSGQWYRDANGALANGDAG